MAKQIQTYNWRNGCFVLMENGRVQNNCKQPFEGVPVSGDFPARFADAVPETAPEPEPEPEPQPRDDGDTSDDVETVPTEDKGDLHDNPYEWW